MEMLECGRSMIYQLCKSGELASIIHAGKRRIYIDSSLPVMGSRPDTYCPCQRPSFRLYIVPLPASRFLLLRAIVA